ncbi:sensor histidine kinase [Pseudactinotalea sp. HY160]|nr:sensor histidine kinase [Pseudactinotalea sp. HY160]
MWKPIPATASTDRNDLCRSSTTSTGSVIVAPFSDEVQRRTRVTATGGFPPADCSRKESGPPRRTGPGRSPTVGPMQQRLARGATILTHLAAIGIVGPVILTSLLTIAVTAIPLVFVFGIGLLLVPLVAFGLRGVAWLETERVSALLGTESVLTPMRRSQRTDGWRVPATVGLQFTDRGSWRALLHLALISALGCALLGLVKVAGTGIVLLLSPLFSARITASVWWLPTDLGVGAAAGIGAIALLLAIGLSYGLIVAHRAISAQMLVPDREAELARAAEASAQRRVEAMHSAEVERLRIERDLHDGVQPRLVSVGMTLGMAKGKLASDPDQAAELIAEAHTSVKSAITELRQLARGIHPAVLTDRGLDAALSALAARSHVPVELDVDLPGRCAPQTEAALYFAIAESITNVAKHSGAQRCRITVRARPNGSVWARIEDDGAGGARTVPGGGIDGVANRIGAGGGSFALISPVGGPTTIEVNLPCAS